MGPVFFGIDKAVTKEMVQGANKGVLQSKALKLLNQPAVAARDVAKLRKEVETWDLRLDKDLDLTKPQLRSLFRAEVTTALEDPDLTYDQKHDAVAGSHESLGLEAEEVVEELQN